jgi:uncharacterized protein YndB with AHSA1/START domain
MAAEVTTERTVPIAAATLYRAWTERFDQWFAKSDSLHMTPEINVPFFFETEFDGRRHAHYGRFLELVPNALVRMTWMTGNPGTGGAETIVLVTFDEHEHGTTVRLTHNGFYDEESRQGHAEAWVMVLEHMEKQLLARE